MDRFISRFDAEADDDLMLCRDEGVAYQKDMSNLVAYDDAYYNKCASYEAKEIANKINAGRVALVNKYVGTNPVCDIGIGSGEFIKNRTNTFGYDVNPVAIEWLKRNDLWAHNLSAYSAYTFFDVIEHVADPSAYFRHIGPDSYVFFSIPIFDCLDNIRASKHYRPGEHLYYFSNDGFVKWMSRHGFEHLETQDFETLAGRENINSYAFKAHRWPSSK